MAKRRGRRDLQNPIANDPLSVLVSRPLAPLTEIEDRRLYHPDGPDRPVLSFTGNPSFVTLEPEVNRNARNSRRKNARALSTKARLVFQGLPGTVSGRVEGMDTVVCVRRQQRREVIFAKGKGGSRHKRRVHRNRNSEIGC